MLAQRWYDNGGLGRLIFGVGLLVLALAIVGVIKLAGAMHRWRGRERDSSHPDGPSPHNGRHRSAG